MLQNEHWKNAAKLGPITTTIELDKAIAHSPLYTPRYNDADAEHSFEKWLMQGNPFTHGAIAGKSLHKAASKKWKHVSWLKFSSVDHVKIDIIIIIFGAFFNIFHV